MTAHCRDGTDQWFVKENAFSTRLGPHKAPRIKCKNCGRENHYDHALPEEGMPGICPNCSSFLREPTEAEHEKFTDFLVWNSHHVVPATE